MTPSATPPTRAVQSSPVVTPTTTPSNTPAPKPGSGSTLSPTPSPAGSTIASPFCGWSKWISQDAPTKQSPGKPYKGDIESIVNIRKTMAVCDHNMMTKIECRTVDKKVSHLSSGEKVTCDTIRGLRCRNAMQADGICEDYEVRLFCDCSPHISTAVSTVTPKQSTGVTPTATPSVCGWTNWMNDHKPDIRGESELLNTLRTSHNFCQTSDIVGIECRTADKKIAAQISGQMNVLCDLQYGGLMCMNVDQPDGDCSDYEIRVLCHPNGMDCSLTPTPALSTSHPEQSTGTQAPSITPTRGSGETPSITPLHSTNIPPLMTTCTSYWSSWINDHNPSSDNNDKEVSASEYQVKTGFCVGGKIKDVNCETVYGVTPDSIGDIMDCNLSSGVACHGDSIVQCSDWKVRYFCEMCGKFEFTTEIVS